MADLFAAAVSSWVAKSKRRTEAVMKESAQRLIAESLTVVGEGGKMRVDTGFLRASGQASLSGLPTGPSRREEGNGDFDYAAVISGWVPGTTLYFGWTAEYALPREFQDGFMRSALQNWQNIVITVSSELREGSRK